MASILGTLSELITPDSIAKISKAISVNTAVVAKGIDAAGPTVLGLLAQSAETPEGAAALMKKIPQEAEASSEAMRDNLLEHLAKNDLSGDGMSSVLGPSANAISSTLSRTAGFNIRPVLAIIAPLMMSLISKAVKTDKLDTAGMTEMLRRESATFMNNPANTQAVSVVQGALREGKQATALRKTFDDLEWMKVRMAPLAAMYLVVMASPSGATAEAQEIKAAEDTISDAVKNAKPASLLNTMFGSELTRNELDILKRDAPPNEKLLGTIKDAVLAVTVKDLTEARTYGDLVMAIATNVANAATEGGFLGMGGNKVTDEEQQALNAIATAISPL